MKSYKRLYEKMLDKDLISAAIDNAARHKCKRHDVIKVLNDKDKYVDIIYDTLVNDAYEPSPTITKIIDRDRGSKKRRYGFLGLLS